MNAIKTTSNASRELSTQGYTVLRGGEQSSKHWQSIVGNHSTQLTSMQASWAELPADEFLRDGGHYRFRRYSVFTYTSDRELILLPHEPHYQSTYRNNMNGGINRDFEAFDETLVGNALLKNIIDYCVLQFGINKQWRIQAHQFKIVAHSNEAGQPTPEGIHKDGADFILIMLLKRKNIRGGVNHVYDNNKRLLFGSVLTKPGDAILLDDQAVWHGVSEVYPVDNNQPAYRDVLVLTFHNEITT